MISGAGLAFTTVYRLVRWTGFTSRRTIADLTFRDGKGTIDGRRQLPTRVQSPRILDGWSGRVRPDHGRLLPAQGAGRAEELRADRRQGRFGHPHLPAGRHGTSGVVRPQAAGTD